MTVNSPYASPTLSKAEPLPPTGPLVQLQNDNLRVLLDVLTDMRKAGLDTILSLPQIVVCGEQSAGKSSVLEALTEIPFPRKDNLCTRFATEITLRRAPMESLSLRIIPARERDPDSQAKLEAFAASITDLSDLPRITDKARSIMGSDAVIAEEAPRPFARDILSITIEGPNRPQLTLVDLPGLVSANTKGVNDQDRAMVDDITDFYIKQERTMCLAVVAATHDYANQRILTKVRDFDPRGERTMGVITKPDRLEPGSGREEAFLALAQNRDIHFDLGWHVVKNRQFTESDFTTDERDASEHQFFQSSLLGQLDDGQHGISTLRTRLSLLLAEHVRRELPNFRRDLELKLRSVGNQLQSLGSRRTTVQECRAYISTITMRCFELTKAAVNGYYQDSYFHVSPAETFSLQSETSLRRLRAAIQLVNKEFDETIRLRGAKFRIPQNWNKEQIQVKHENEPTILSEDETFEWVRQAMTRSRGKESLGNYNPLVIGELFWEQSTPWIELSAEHINKVTAMCSTFVSTLLRNECPEDITKRWIYTRLSAALNTRHARAVNELQALMKDYHDHPMVYNHYYTDTVQKTRKAWQEQAMRQAHEEAMVSTKRSLEGTIDVKELFEATTNKYLEDLDRNMERYSCKDILNYMLSIYKTQQKVFIANVTTQVIERHLVRDLDNIFCPSEMAALTDKEILSLAEEPRDARTRRQRLTEEQNRLLKGQQRLNDVCGLVN